MFSQIGKYGKAYTFQPHIGQNNFSLFKANGNSTTVSVLGMAVSATGTATAANVAITNQYTMMKRISTVSSSIAGSSAGYRSAVAQYLIGSFGGFHFIGRFGFNDAAAVAQARSFIGITATTTGLANANPSTYLNMIGVGNDSLDANLQIMFNGASGTATKVDLGSAFPANSRGTDFYEASIYCPPNSTSVYIQVTNLSTGATISGTATIKIPSSATLLTWQTTRNNGTTALAVTLDHESVYIETEY